MGRFAAGLACTNESQGRRLRFHSSTGRPAGVIFPSPMTSILEIPEVRQRVSQLSVEEYHRLDEFNDNGKRTELIRGVIIEKMSKSPLHSMLASRLYKLILAVLPDGFLAWKEEPLTLSDSEPEPDISVVRGREQEFVTSHPTTAELVVEVAVVSPALDRELASLYAEAD